MTTSKLRGRRDKAASTCRADTVPSPVEVQSSATASKGGLSEAYAGGQVAEGANLGILGAQDVMETPYNVTSYTEQLIEDQQAASVGEVLQDVFHFSNMNEGVGNDSFVIQIRNRVTQSFEQRNGSVFVNGSNMRTPRRR